MASTFTVKFLSVQKTAVRHNLQTAIKQDLLLYSSEKSISQSGILPENAVQMPGVS